MTTSSRPSTCAGCGGPVAADQRYCLNCGSRVADPRVEYERLLAPATTTSAVPEAGRATPADGPRTVAPLGAAAGIGLLLLAVLVGAVVGAGREQSSAPAPVVVAGTTPASVPAAAFASDWTGDDGWTVQLQVLTKTSTTPQQVADAKAAASAAGATAVGALDSDEHGSLDPGNYVVYSGVHASAKDAKAALKELRGAFPDAEVVEVAAVAAHAADDAGDAGEPSAGEAAIEELESATPDEYVKKSRKLPNELGTDGAAPPVDDAPPGGGSDEALVID